jgi:hypothetical protein
MKYKRGQEVEITGPAWNGKQIDDIGFRTRIECGPDDDGDYEVTSPSSLMNVQHYPASSLRLVNADPWDNLVPGETVLVDGDHEALILAWEPRGKAYLRSAWGNFEEARAWYTVAEAKRHGWTIKGAEPAKPKTITLKRGNYTADDLRAKLQELEG